MADDAKDLVPLPAAPDAQPAARPAVVRQARDRIIAHLSDLFAHDDLDVDEFERRVTLAHTAETVTELDRIVVDLPAPAAASAPAPAVIAESVTSMAIVPASQVRASQTVAAIMGGVERKGNWLVPRRLNVVAIMGGADLDFREARLPAGVSEIQVGVLMGGVNIIVPPGLPVEIGGVAIMGGFAHVDRAPTNPDPEAPMLRVGGVAIMGGVHIETRLPGESQRQARKRERKERRELTETAREAERAKKRLR